MIRLFLVRHALSEANLDNTVNARMPDHAIPLAPEGAKQATATGEALVQYLRENTAVGRFGRVGGERVRILTSPYLRTRQTADGIQKVLDANNVLFDRREATELREISFGLFDGISDEELPIRFPNEHAHYKKCVDFDGEFWARMPLGESRVEVADRVKQTFGTILRDTSAARHEKAVHNFIIVSHGVTLRTFRMQWLHKPWEWYGEQKNPDNASISMISGHPGNYSEEVIFEGFPHIRTKQDRREDGVVE